MTSSAMNNTQNINNKNIEHIEKQRKKGRPNYPRRCERNKETLTLLLFTSSEDSIEIWIR